VGTKLKSFKSDAKFSMTRWASFREGMELTHPFQVSEKDLAAFRELSGDNNPLHLDDTYAKTSGFEGRIVYGGLLIAVISRLLGTQVPGPGCLWHTLSLRFLKPLYVKQSALLKATVTYCNMDLQVLRLSISILRGADLIADGSVQASGVRLGNVSRENFK
jgi:3-hydroxybutyryl-CoA dehydratase